jgi:GT2 family glycosyltransferase
VTGMNTKPSLLRRCSNGAVRYAKAMVMRAQKIAFYARPFFDSPRRTYPILRRLMHSARSSGIEGVRKTVRQLPFELDFQQLWTHQYLPSFTIETLCEFQRRIASLANEPPISILLPVSDTTRPELRATLDSIQSQLYENWELCVVLGPGVPSETQHWISEVSAGESRVRVQDMDAEMLNSGSLQAAIDVMQGRICLMLETGIILEPQALFRIRECIFVDDPDMIYSDEAKLATNGLGVVDHHYRPSFSLEFFRSSPFDLPLVAVRTALLKNLAGHFGLSTQIERYDLVLRVAENAQCIAHIPEILFLRAALDRASEFSDSVCAKKKAREVLNQHLERCHEIGDPVDGPHPNYFDVRYAIISDDLRVAIIIPTKNCGKLVRQCIESIQRTVKQVPYEIVIIDHASDDECSVAYFESLKQQHQVLQYDGPFNFSAINNWAVSQVRGNFTHYLFCNNDIEAINEDWLERMVELGQKLDVGMVGAKLLYPDGESIQHAGVCVGMYGVAEHYGKSMSNVLTTGEEASGYHGSLIANHEMSAVTAACALVRKDAFELVGGFEEDLAVGFGDVDLCLKVREAGYRIMFCAHSVLIHHESYTRGKSREDPHPVDTAKFVRKWRNVLDRCDPFYNPNLTIQSTRWEVRQPLAITRDIDRRVWRRSERISGRSQVWAVEQHLMVQHP